MIREGNGLPIAWSILSGSLCIVRILLLPAYLYSRFFYRILSSVYRSYLSAVICTQILGDSRAFCYSLIPPRIGRELLYLCDRIAVFLNRRFERLFAILFRKAMFLVSLVVV
jgi:hypothetical protein